MHHPPEPHYSFTIPSIHDDTTLDCRIYHPHTLTKLQPDASTETTPWRIRGIVMGHPYAPLGGSYDDRVVGIVVDEFWKAGWVVGTFNFRGAHGSKGRTSWSGRPELDDYISFSACFMHYLSYLEPHPYTELDNSRNEYPSKVQPPDSAKIPSEQVSDSPVIVLGGYSYGSYILRHLPPVPTILQTFEAPQAGSAAEEILLRARKLSAQSNLDRITLARRQDQEGRTIRNGKEATTCVRMGGEETSPELRRPSRDIRRSLDGGLRAGVGNRLRSLSYRRCEAEHTVTTPEEPQASALSTMPQVRYLLISPLMPPISTLAAPALGRKIWSRGAAGGQEAIGKHLTLVVYGDNDTFTSARKLRDWTSQLQAAPKSLFSSVEVSGAGHFWFEPGVEERLRVALREWEAEV